MNNPRFFVESMKHQRFRSSRPEDLLQDVSSSIGWAEKFLGFLRMGINHFIVDMIPMIVDYRGYDSH